MSCLQFLHQLLVLDLHQPSEKSAEILGDLSQVLTSSAERIRRALSQVRLLKSLYWNFRETHVSFPCVLKSLLQPSVDDPCLTTRLTLSLISCATFLILSLKLLEYLASDLAEWWY